MIRMVAVISVPSVIIRWPRIGTVRIMSYHGVVAVVDVNVFAVINIDIDIITAPAIVNINFISTVVDITGFVSTSGICIVIDFSCCAGIVVLRRPVYIGCARIAYSR